jgi:hypothetical protein
MVWDHWFALFGTPLLMALSMAIGFFLARFLDSLEPVRYHLQNFIQRGDISNFAKFGRGASRNFFFVCFVGRVGFCTKYFSFWPVDAGAVCRRA